MSKTQQEPTAEEQLREIATILYRRRPEQFSHMIVGDYRRETLTELVARLVEPPQSNDDADRRVKEAILDRIKSGNGEAVKALKRLVNLKLDGPFPLKKGVYGEDPKADRLSSCPFFTEAYLYALFGKEDARTILAILRRVCEALGTTICELQHEGEAEDED